MNGANISNNPHDKKHARDLHVDRNPNLGGRFPIEPDRAHATHKIELHTMPTMFCFGRLRHGDDARKRQRRPSCKKMKRTVCHLNVPPPTTPANVCNSTVGPGGAKQVPTENTEEDCGPHKQTLAMNLLWRRRPSNIMKNVSLRRLNTGAHEH